MKSAVKHSLILALASFALACGDEADGPCEQLQLCCDALFSNDTSPLSCQPIPFEDSECQRDLDALPAFAMGLELPTQCLQ